MVHHNSKKSIRKLTIFRSRHAWRSKKHFSASFIDNNLSSLLACSIKSYCQRYSVASFWCPSIHSKDVIVVCPFCCLVTPYKVRAILHSISFSYYYRATKRRVLWKSCKEQITHYDDKHLKQMRVEEIFTRLLYLSKSIYIETLRQKKKLQKDDRRKMQSNRVKVLSGGQRHSYIFWNTWLLKVIFALNPLSPSVATATKKGAFWSGGIGVSAYSTSGSTGQWSL